jgi:hypothetical protein
MMRVSLCGGRADRGKRKGRQPWADALQGRKLTAAHDHGRPSVEALHLIRKLRWIGMEEEAERIETQLHETTLAGGVITAVHETD